MEGSSPTQLAAPAFRIEVEVPAPPERVREFLADLHNVAELHPLIVGIEELEARSDRPEARHYEIRDVIGLGPFRLRTRYRAAIEIVSPTELWATAWQPPGVRLDTRYQLAASAAGTRLVERVWIRVPRWLPGLHGFVRRQAEAAHRVSLGRLGAHLAGT